jgi:hypothetical protein
MRCEVEYTEEFEEWWTSLDQDEQTTVDAYVRLLEQFGVGLGYPYSSDVKGSKFAQMRELRPQHQGRPYRVLYAFDPRRMALLLIGGDKTGNDRWYDEYVPMAERLYSEHLRELNREDSSDG